MNTGITSARYAKALLRFATENGEEQLVYDEMEQLLQSFVAAPRLSVMLQNPALPLDKQVALLIAAATSAKAKMSVSIVRFMDLLCKQKRADLAQYVAVSYLSQYRQSKGFIEASLTTAVPATEAVTQRMRSLVEKRTGCKVSFDVKTDESIGAGFVLEYDTYRMDASLKRQFADLKRAMAG